MKTIAIFTLGLFAFVLVGCDNSEDCPGGVCPPKISSVDELDDVYGPTPVSAETAKAVEAKIEEAEVEETEVDLTED